MKFLPFFKIASLPAYALTAVMGLAGSAFAQRASPGASSSRPSASTTSTRATTTMSSNSARAAVASNSARAAVASNAARNAALTSGAARSALAQSATRAATSNRAASMQTLRGGFGQPLAGNRAVAGLRSGAGGSVSGGRAGGLPPGGGRGSSEFSEYEGPGRGGSSGYNFSGGNSGGHAGSDDTFSYVLAINGIPPVYSNNFLPWYIYFNEVSGEQAKVQNRQQAQEKKTAGNAEVVHADEKTNGYIYAGEHRPGLGAP